MNLVQSIAISNDVYFYKLAVALGPDAVIDTARALGVGAPTGIDLPGESAGYLGTPGLRAGEGRRAGTAGPPSSSASARATCRSRRCRTRGGPPPSPPGTLVTPAARAWRSAPAGCAVHRAARARPRRRCRSPLRSGRSATGCGRP